MKVIIAEKPSVAAGIAKLVGATTAHREKATGYLEGGGYQVTWAFGHLVKLQSPEEMGFAGDVLPIMPGEWKTKIITGGDKEMERAVEKQMKNINALFDRASEIIVATDAGREGELIFRYIYEYTGCTTPFSRLWISSMEESAIRDGMRSLLPASRMNALSDAAHSRSEADWLIGFNASRALRVATGYKGAISLGRVQTPVLGMICERYEANINFVPTPFWQVTAIVHKDMDNFQVVSSLKYTSEQAAKDALAMALASKRMKVNALEKKQVESKTPLLYDLTALQRAANTKLGLTAEQTLNICQSLYLKKYLTYPRTGSRYITEDVYRSIPSLIKKVGSEYPRFADAAAEREGKKLPRRCVNPSKVTDHHALLPTHNIPKDLQGDEKTVWEMVAGRMLESFGENALSERTSAEFDCGGVTFKAGSTVITKPGWKSVFGVNEEEEQKRKNDGQDDDDDDTPNVKLPPLREGEVLPAGKFETVQKTDKPLPIYNDNSLLGEMETCGKRIEDEELRESLKEVGLGTPATRAETIELLIRRHYVERKGKKLIPTELGQRIYSMVRGLKIADVKTSGEMERDLGLVEQGKMPKETFDRAIRQFVEDVIEEIRRNCSSLEGVSITTEPARSCPFCGKPMVNGPYSVYCSEESGGCGFKINREIAKKKIPPSAIDALCKGKPTAELKGFMSKSGKAFSARLALDRENRKVAFDLSRHETPKGPELKGLICPCCGREMEDTPWKLTCGCGFILYKTLGDVPLEEEKIRALLSGESVTVKNMRSKTGKKYSAKVKVNTASKKLDYDFINK